MKSIITKILCFFIRLYQICISPLFPPCCRYYPSCSHYAIDALKKHGPAKGSVLAFKRIMRCTPYHAGGYDSVP
ncbi:MAG: membrane protein insertion efficiency factor YidD [Treponema sp.]|nr:membrane protein insertion efficiency factor YidD [Treponema sp.]